MDAWRRRSRNAVVVGEGIEESPSCEAMARVVVKGGGVGALYAPSCSVSRSDWVGVEAEDDTEFERRLGKGEGLDDNKKPDEIEKSVAMESRL